MRICHRMNMLVFLAVVAMSLIGSSTCFGANSVPQIYPQPKEIKYTGEYMPLFGADGNPVCAIVTGSNPAQKISIGAGEINAKVKDTCGRELPVIQGTGTETDKYANLIYIGLPSTNPAIARLTKKFSVDLAPAQYADQGYKVSFVKDDGRQIALLSSRSEQGALYACITFRSLIIQGTDNPRAACAQINDWPDFKYRNVESIGFMYGYRKAFGFFEAPDLAGGTRITKEHIDELLRLKVNMASIDIDQPVPGTATDEFCSGAPNQVGWLKEMSQYARERGVDPYFIKTVGIECQMTDAQLSGWEAFRKSSNKGFISKPVNNFCVSLDGYSPWNVYRFCWSSDDLLAKEAKRAARYIKEMQVTRVILHPVDAYNEKWENRCEQCRKRFGDDHSAAQANVLSIYSRVLHEKCPGVIVTAVPRPYGATDINLPANKWLKDRLDKISAGISDDDGMAFTFGSINEVEALRQNIKRPLVHWLNLGCSIDYGGTFLCDPVMAFIKNYYTKTRGKDALFICGATNKLQQAWLASATWNTECPLGNRILESDRIYKIPNKENFSTPGELIGGRGTIDYWSWSYNGKDFDYFDTCKELSNDVLFRGTLEQLCCNVYGNAAGKMLAGAYLSGYSGRYTDTPALFKSSGGYNAYDKSTARYMGDYYSRMSQAEAGLAGLSNLKPSDLPASATTLAETYGVASTIEEAKAKSFMWWSLLSLQESINDPAKFGEIAEFYDSQAKKHIENVCAFYDGLPSNIAGLIGAKWKKAAFIKWCDGMSAKYDSMIMGMTSGKQGTAALGKAKYKGGKIHAAVYNPTEQGGAVYGYKAIYGTLENMPNVEVSYVNKITEGTLAPFDCLFIPDAKKLSSDEKQAEFLNTVRNFCSGGGGVYLQHDSAGYHRFALGSSIFPEVASVSDSENGAQLLVSCSHPLTAGMDVGSTATHMYYDHMLLKPGKSSEVVLTNSKGVPVVVAGRVGAGKVVFDGTIAYKRFDNSEGEISAAEQINDPLIRNAVAWFCQQEEKAALEVSDIHINKVVQADALHYVLAFKPQALFSKQLSPEKVYFKARITDEAGKALFEKTWDETVSGNSWQPVEETITLDLPIDPGGKLLCISAQGLSSTIAERIYKIF